MVIVRQESRDNLIQYRYSMCIANDEQTKHQKIKKNERNKNKKKKKKEERHKFCKGQAQFNYTYE